MPTLESTLRSINRRIKEMYDTFGATSIQYNQLKSFVYTALPELDILVRTPEGKPMALSRGKRATDVYIRGEYEDDVKELWSLMQEYGTAKEHKEGYRERLESQYGETIEELDDWMADIRELSHAEYQKSYLDEDYYAALQSRIAELEEADDLNEADDEYLEQLKDIQSEFSEKGKTKLSKWEKAEKALKMSQQRHEQFLIDHPEVKSKGKKHDLGSNWDMST